MSGNVSGKEAAAIALASGHTQIEAAEAAGVDPRTIARWVKEPDFAAQVRALRNQGFDEAVRVLNAASAQAARRMAALAVDDYDPTDNGRLRLSACRAVLQMSADLGMVADIEARLTALEAAQ